MIPIPSMLAGPLVWGLGIALALSVAGNGILMRAWLGQRDETAVANTERNQARTAAQECSERTEAMQETARLRARAAIPARAAAQAKAETLTKQADQVLATPATVPSDDCKSAADRVDLWWQGRAKP
jgi:hypothetical protein